MDSSPDSNNDKKPSPSPNQISPANIITQAAPSLVPHSKTKLEAAMKKVNSNINAQKPLQEKPSLQPTVNVVHEENKSGFATFLSCLFPCFCQAERETRLRAVPLSNLSQTPSKMSGVHSTAENGLLPPIAPEFANKKCLVLDLDETLVHSSFKPVAKADFIIQVEIDKTVHQVYVLKRPGVDEFLRKLSTQYELVVFTASLSKYANPVMDMLDPHRYVKHRLFRESCIHHKGNYVKDLSLLGRNLKSVIIIDNQPSCYMFHPSNAIPITTWFDDPTDVELLDLIPFLEDLKLVQDVTTVLDSSLE
ncbi:hypothetical protein HDV02_002865 [Globomyces sp. JEL0801]|nr:hypothetical protein HDV02_002865 [Globomyces sp. JEL0801]